MDQTKFQQLEKNRKSLGISVRKYSDRKKIPYSTYTYWQRKLQSQDGKGFVEVLQSVGSNPIYIQTPKGYTIKLEAGFDSELLGKALSALEQAGC